MEGRSPGRTAAGAKQGVSEFEILPPADAILVQVAPALLQVLNHEDIAIGGGTVLAARWQHRQSTDICLTVPPPAFERESGRMAELLKAAAVTDVLHGRGWLTGICANGEFSISTTPPLLRSPAKPADHEGRFGILLEPTAEILGRKLRLRMYNNGEFVSRDFYDICTAHERDPSALDQALSSLTEDMGHEIARGNRLPGTARVPHGPAADRRPSSRMAGRSCRPDGEAGHVTLRHEAGKGRWRRFRKVHER